MPPIPTAESTAPTHVDLPRAGVGHVAHEPDAREHDHDDHVLEQRTPTRHDRNVVMKPPRSGPTAAAIAAAAPTSA